MNALLVSVDYADLLAITLPYNRHHFDRVVIVTAPGKPDTEVAHAHGAEVFITDAFYRRGAVFNKWLALEEGLDWMGRSGWICLMDADVLWPKWVSDRPGEGAIWRYLRPGFLFGALRRMWDGWPRYPEWLVPLGPHALTPPVIPPEIEWQRFPLHRNVAEWAGYTQIFHAGDPVLGSPPWHEVDWAHGGGSDSMFQRRWPLERKVRLPFEVLHLGPAGANWCGRATVRADGTVPAEARERRELMDRLWAGRRGKPTEAERFRHEKLR